MRIPVANNKLVTFTLAGAFLTALVAGGLAFPGVGLGQSDSPGTSPSDASQQVASDAPTPNQDFTPTVQTQSGYEDEEHEEYDEHEDDEDHEEEYEAGDEDEDNEEDE
ncbi:MULTISPECIES: hypothetical protein [Haloarcula]|uniref:Uncharacterized protein n=2 Tax=Haloarcula sebkhae TaxID=932660 RepID=A0ACC6VS05_9EURY|nr:hypothetical protein [Haloarcula sebkhae]GGK77069.1 hypothetical protein GCM10009067_31860 [Haloarcula sebkhae]